MAKDKFDAVSSGVGEAFDFWLSQHPISVPEMIETAIEKSITKWMDVHSDEIIYIITKRLGHGKP
jgi:hypothetical protein